MMLANALNDPDLSHEEKELLRKRKFEILLMA
jgi:hypothetical protein